MFQYCCAEVEPDQCEGGLAAHASSEAAGQGLKESEVMKY